MKFIILTFLLYTFFVSNYALADSSSLSVVYPPNESHQTITLGTLASAPDCTQAGNLGTLFMDNNKTLSLCAKVGNKYVQVPYHEQCFNRFCSCPINSPTSASCSTLCQDTNNFGTLNSPDACPIQAGFTQLTTTVAGVTKNVVYTFITATNPTTYTSYSTVCCSSDANGVLYNQ